MVLQLLWAGGAIGVWLIGHPENSFSANWLSESGTSSTQCSLGLHSHWCFCLSSEANAEVPVGPDYLCQTPTPHSYPRARQPSINASWVKKFFDINLPLIHQAESTSSENLQSILPTRRYLLLGGRRYHPEGCWFSQIFLAPHPWSWAGPHWVSEQYSLISQQRQKIEEKQNPQQKWE